MKFSLWAAILVALMAGCGGGGGSDGESGGSSARTGVRIIHASLDAAPVEVTSSDVVEVVQRAAFSDTPLFAPLRPGDVVLSLRTAVTGADQFYQAPHTILPLQRLSLFLHGNGTSLGFRVSAIEEIRPALLPGRGALRILHGIVGAGALDVEIGETDAGTVPFGSAGEYIQREAGTYPITIRRSADRMTVYSTALTFDPGAIRSLVVQGEIGLLTVTRLLDDN